MSLFALAAVLPLAPIVATDPRLDLQDTFVSDAAELALSASDGERVLCLDRHKVRSICLAESEWLKAIDAAANAPKKGPRAIIPHNNPRSSSTSKYGLASSPSTFRSSGR